MGDETRTRERRWDYSTYLYVGGVLMVIGVAMFAAGVENDNIFTFLGAVATLLGFSAFLIGAVARGVELGVRAATEDPE